MSDLTLLGFPRSTFVQIVGLVLTHKDVLYTFRDLEPDMDSPVHLALHPFDRVPILQHGDFTLYETSAIVAYLEEVFPMPSLQPETTQGRARMNQWISAVIPSTTRTCAITSRTSVTSSRSLASHPTKRSSRTPCRRSRSHCK